jgi:hypothetical protein
MHHTVLEQALSNLKPSNHLQNGVMYLGTPIGNPNYIETALSNAAKQFDIQQKGNSKPTGVFAPDKDDFIFKMPPPIDPPLTSN